MPTSQPVPLSVNRLLALLPPDDYRRISRRMQPVSLPLRQTIYKVRAAIDSVYFPTSGFISAMTVMEDGAAIEVATIGNEGMTGMSAVVGGETSPYEMIVQIACDGVRMSIDAAKEEWRRDGLFHRLLVKYNTAFAMQVAYSVACNGLHKIEQRCCRWLLMTADRVGKDALPLTHEFLAVMLGVRRSSISEVLRPLQERGLLSNNRGEIRIVDRAGMEATSCECYRAVKSEFTRLFGA